MGRLPLALSLAIAVMSCTEVYDYGPDGLGSQLDGDGYVDPACQPDPCVAEGKRCVGGVCTECLPGYLMDGQGNCLSTEDPCVPDPCASVHKECINGFCGECMEGYIPIEGGHCLAPNACYPNPCTELQKTVCTVDVEGKAVCVCDVNTHLADDGSCTFDPCNPDPCIEEPFTHCSHDPLLGPLPTCGCDNGFLATADECVADPCDPNPCTGYARTICVLDEEGLAVCKCNKGYYDQDGVCLEAAVINDDQQPPSPSDVVIDHDAQLFMDGWMIHNRVNLVRRTHAAGLAEDTYVVDADPEFDIVRARAAGALVHVDADERAELPEGHPVADYPWRLYYMGQREATAEPSQPAWLCLAVALDAAGPWTKPILTDGDPVSHCLFRVDGLVVTDVSLDEGTWLLSTSRIALGEVSQPGLYLFESDDGLTWSQLQGGDPVVQIADYVLPPAAYQRIGEVSRIIYDPWEWQYFGLFSLPSPALGDARGTMFGSWMPTLGWLKEPDPVSSPAVLGPEPDELATNIVYGDMTAWRMGSLWIGLLQKKESVCPKRSYLTVVTSRDGAHWYRVTDEVSGTDEAVAWAGSDGKIHTSIDSLSGGRPAEEDGTWHLYSGGIPYGPCSIEPPSGGLVHHSIRLGGFAGLVADPATQGVLITRPMTFDWGLTGSRLHINAKVGVQLLVQVESLSSIDTVLDAEDVVVTAGDYRDAEVAIGALNSVTTHRFRLRFTFHGGGELFGFRINDPLCTPNPCTEPMRTTCDSSSGEVVCQCDWPYHDDGEGVCTTDPCKPDPCTAAHEEGCTPIGGEALCGCEDGWVKADGICIPDPCEPSDGVAPCAPPGPDRCQSINGEVNCYCPEGSEAGAAGCYETQMRAFVTSLKIKPENLAGTQGGDDLCSSLATSAGLPGSYVAWLSSAESAVVDRLVWGGPWRTWDPEVQMWTALVASNLPDLTDAQLASPLVYTESAGSAGDKCLAWTGTQHDGVAPPANDPFAGTCGGWTTSDPTLFGLAGFCGTTDAGWTAWGPAQCGQGLRLYCFQKSEGAEPEPECGDGMCNGDETEESCPDDCAIPGDSCEGKCGEYDAEASCQCDASCVDFGDCCGDYDEHCAG